DMKSTRCMVEFEDEIRLDSAGGFRSKHDDFLDTISMLALMNPIPPSQEIRMEYNDSEMIWEEASQRENTYQAGESYIV
ncbi:hypothetical protein, partial [Staphylococcus aureus]|uniref:hypothetical protein n=1 Tax=Staphylococcus aureus TaxID=1280 RepID=UPI001C2F03F5